MLSQAVVAEATVVGEPRIVDSVDVWLPSDGVSREVYWTVLVGSFGIFGVRNQYPAPAATTTATRTMAISFEPLPVKVTLSLWGIEENRKRIGVTEHPKRFYFPRFRR
jgi:hypothetical protein